MLNRYFTKTLYKGVLFQRAVSNASALSGASQTHALFRLSKMGFFDYDNKDKNIFTSSSDDEYQKKKPAKRGKFGEEKEEDSFFAREGKRKNKHEGKFEVSEIPLYITKMREEMKDLREGIKDRESYFPRIKSFIAMHFQNKDRIFAEFPRSSTIFYEYASYKMLDKEGTFLNTLEDHIVKDNLSNMPIPGIKNLLRAMVKLNRGRTDILDKIVQHLADRNAYKDVKSNLAILSYLTNVRAHISEEYMKNSLQAIQDEANMQISEGMINLKDEKRTTLNTTRQILNRRSFITLINIVTRYILNENIEFTQQEVEDFVKRHPTTEVSGVKFVQANQNTKSAKDQLLLVIYQFSLLHENEGQVRDLLNLKYLQSCHPAVYENIPGIKGTVDRLMKEQKERVQKAKEDPSKEFKAKLNQTQTKLANILDELGYFYKNFERIDDLFLVQFYLPNEKVLLEYLSPRDYIKTENVRENKKYDSRYLLRKTVLEKNGHNVVNIDFFDLIDHENKRSEFLELIKQRVGEVKK